jgi:hypothetical protein
MKPRVSISVYSVGSSTTKVRELTTLAGGLARYENAEVNVISGTRADCDEGVMSGAWGVEWS